VFRVPGGCFAWTIAACLWAAHPAHAQPLASIAGSVTDPTGLALTHVVVTIDGPVESSVTTGTDGTFAFTSLPEGEYQLTAERPQFATVRRAVHLGPGQVARVALTLPVQLLERTEVTAGRLGESAAQSTAMSISALPAADLDRVQTHTIGQLSGIVPSVTFSQNSDFAQLTIRGIGSNVVFAGSDPSSAVYVDGVYLARPVMVTTDFLDLARVEIVRGPQGTLYGRNAVGGAINLITKSPTNEFEASADVSGGDHGLLRTQLRLSGPIVQRKVLASGSFLRGVRTGYVHDVDHPDHSLGGEDVTAARGQLRLLLGSRGELLASGDAMRQDPFPLTYAKVLQVKPGFQVDNPPGLHQVRASTLATSRIAQQGASARLTLSLPHRLTLTSLSAFRELDYRLVNDADITELSILTAQLDERQHQLSQEITVSSTRPGLSWIAGTFWFDETDRQPTRVGFAGPRLMMLLDPRVDATTTAVFAQASLDIAPRVRATAGLRYSDERKTIANYGQSSSMDPPGAIVPGSVYAYNDTNAYEAWTPKVGVELEPADKTLVYASATRGFKSGGFNISSREPGLGYAPEWVWTYETGLKKTSASDRTQLSLAVFHTDYTDLQVQTPIRPGVLDISNAAAATIKGVEIEGIQRLTAAARAGGHVAWLDATYDRYQAVGIGGITGDAAGHRLNNAPEWSGRAWFEWGHPVGSHHLTLHADSRWQSTVFFTPFNDTVQRQQAYGILDVSASFGPKHARWSISAFARNLTDTDHITGTFATPPPAIGARPGDPRQLGVRLRVSR
jgi:iron complex outermembrane receptor protein